MEDMSKRIEPLAYRMSPRTLDEYVGQEHILGKGRMLRRMIEADKLSSIILFGPPGTGKTSLARIIAATTKTGFNRINAVTAGVADIKRIIADTQNHFITPSGRTVLFIDEIHRFNKAQQDALLPQVEDGTLILIGATTENPFFEVNKALISRSTVFQLYALTEDDIKTLLLRAIEDEERGFGRLKVKVEDDAMAFWTAMSGGDARIALNALELAVATTPPAKDGVINITLEVAIDCMQKKSPAFDKDGEAHYDTISAFIKSMRGSDPDAAVYYLARALYGGEDVAFLGRRMIIAAAEDVGLANPQMLSIAVAATQAAMMIGMPEARIILAEAAVAIATSPKSNRSYLAINEAMSDVATEPHREIPMRLRNAPAKGMEAVGYHKGYRYAHDYQNAFIDESYLPESLEGRVYYEPSDRGYEAKIRSWYKRLKGEKENVSEK